MPTNESNQQIKMHFGWKNLEVIQNVTAIAVKKKLKRIETRIENSK